MMELVAAAFREDGVAAIEAPTGIGKTLAYLAPAVRFAAESGERVVISTQTIALQEQILEKDLPLVAAALNTPVQAALLKGRGNYLCRRKLKAALSEERALFAGEEPEPLLRIARWVDGHSEGSKADLGFLPSAELWEGIKSDRDSCLRTRCPHHERCYYYRARRAAQQAQILVVNHHLLLADLAIKAGRSPDGEGDPEGVLPAWKRLVLDEAHHLESVASVWFGAEASRLGLTRTLRRLTGDHSRAALPGLLPSLRKALLEGAGSLDQARRAAWLDAADRIERRLIPFARWLEAARIAPAFSALGAWARAVAPESQDEGELKVRVPAQGDARWEREVEPLLGELADPPEGISGLADELRDLLKVIAPPPGGEEEGEPVLAGPRVDLQGTVAILERAVSTVEMVVRASGFESLPGSRPLSVLPGSGPSALDFVRWAEVDREGRSARLVATPIELGPFLARHLFGAHSTVILSSATLFGGGSVRERATTSVRLGLDRLVEGRLVTECLPSPFDWKEQALLLLPTDLPAPDDLGWEEALPEEVLAAVEASGGGAFVLFTSLRLMEQVHAALAPRLAALGMLPLRQGEEDRGALLQRFRQERSAVLFGSDSFWEGVDVPGDALRNVVITRLPFRMPKDPVLIARAERRAAEGGDPFAELTVPAAVIKLRQGLGRLIRTRSDRGLLVILDSRVVHRSYGRHFLQAIPPCRVEQGPSVAVFAAGREFFRSSPPAGATR